MVTIPEGWFWMGDDRGRDEERPVHRVRVSRFALAATTVANRDYRCFVEATGHAPAPLADAPGFDDPNQPVVSVSWIEATAYCEWLSQKTGKVCRLPTEAEWEKAARGGFEKGSYPWGNEPPDESLFHGLHPRQDRPLPVATTPSNGFGLFEMCLNVHEWCADWYDARFYARSPEENPVNVTESGRRASRGGSWRHAVKFSRAAARSSIPPAYCYADYGFRIAHSLG